MDPLTALIKLFTKHNIVEKIRPPIDCPRHRLADVLNAKKGHKENLNIGRTSGKVLVLMKV